MRTKSLRNYLIIVFSVYSIYLVVNYLISFIVTQAYVFIIFSNIIFLFIIMYSFFNLSRLTAQNTEITDRNLDQRLNNLILSKSPSGIIVISREGVIEYVNGAIGTILGSTETTGQNILTFETVQKSRMYGGIIAALSGTESELKNVFYISKTSGEEKYLNIYVYPIFTRDFMQVEKVVVMLTDITEETALSKKIEATYITTIESLAGLVDAKDKYTGEHSKNVLKYTNILLDKLDLNELECEKIRLAASLHDIGKIGISDIILNKPSNLSEEEYTIMKKHPSIGANIIKKIDGFGEVSEMIRYHHERWDGRGYPDGLKDVEIPLGSQVIAIADTFDAITSYRVYRSALSKDTAIRILLEERGQQFNKELVDLFIYTLKQNDYVAENIREDDSEIA